MHRTSLIRALLSVLWIGTAYGAEPEITFESQLQKIFEAAPTAPDLFIDRPSSDVDRKILARILDKIRNHQLMLKNVVFRPDMDVIRITWADDANQDIVKVAYKTQQDPILGNSKFANKQEIVDVKIMFKTAENEYSYLRLQPPALAEPRGERIEQSPPQSAQFSYNIQAKLSNEQCGFCHVLAKNDGSSSGIFFPRYQEGSKRFPLAVGMFYHKEHFALKRSKDAKALGLPEMLEDFEYQKVLGGSENFSTESVKFIRSLIEMPQLIEVMARDNKRSICVASDLGPEMERLGMGRNDYVCADNKAQKLHVRLTNARLTSNQGPKEYFEPYYEIK